LVFDYSTPRVRNAQEAHFNPKTVFIGPDHTKLEREQDIKLRKELAKKNVRATQTG
jgi:hypothetical protein